MPTKTKHPLVWRQSGERQIATTADGYGVYEVKRGGFNKTLWGTSYYEPSGRGYYLADAKTLAAAKAVCEAHCEARRGERQVSPMQEKQARFRSSR